MFVFLLSLITIICDGINRDTVVLQSYRCTSEAFINYLAKECTDSHSKVCYIDILDGPDTGSFMIVVNIYEEDFLFLDYVWGMIETSSMTVFLSGKRECNLFRERLFKKSSFIKNSPAELTELDDGIMMTFFYDGHEIYKVKWTSTKPEYLLIE